MVDIILKTGWYHQTNDSMILWSIRLRWILHILLLEFSSENTIKHCAVIGFLAFCSSHLIRLSLAQKMWSRRGYRRLWAQMCQRDTVQGLLIFFFRRSSRCSTCKSCKCAALCCPSLLQKFRLGTGDVAGVCLPALSRKEQALVFATGSTKFLLILVLVISGSCKLYTPSYIGKISQTWDA